nr:MAG TPA: hypothetical protein [Bacteriophage sp.]
MQNSLTIFRQIKKASKQGLLPTYCLFISIVLLISITKYLNKDNIYKLSYFRHN